MLLLCHEDSPGADRHVRTVATFREPLIAVCTPQQYCDSGVFGRLTPAGTGKTDRFDSHWDRLAEDCEKKREQNSCYGLLNYGCVIHSGSKIWENGEYDHPHCYLLLFARTGDRRWYFLAEKAARHFMDVDSVNYGSHTGAVYAHVIGHTGDYFDTPPPPYPKDHRKRRLWGSPDHSWLEGFCDWYCVSGDRTALEKARNAGEYYAGSAMTNNYEFSNLRESGWYIILLMGVYNLTHAPSLLNAARIVAERVLEKQTPGPRGWHRQMAPAHCFCTPRHRGACIYMLSILCRGLETYYEVTGDERIAEAIVGGADQAIDECWKADHRRFAPTSCPAVTEQPNWDWGGTFFPTPVQMLLFSYRRTGKTRYLDVAKNVIADTPLAEYHWVPWWTKAFYHMSQIESIPERQP